MDDPGVPGNIEPRIAPRSSRGKLGHFVHDVGYDGLAHYLAAYRAAMAQLPSVAEHFDIPTTFGTVRVYRFDGPPGAGDPVLLVPGRNAATPMWRDNLPYLLTKRTVYCLDLLGEAGLSVQDAMIRDADDQAHWLDEALAGLSCDRAHLMGASIGGWAVANFATRRPGCAKSLTLLDPVMTFDRIPLLTLLASAAMVSPGVPEILRRRFLRWLSGGSSIDDGEPVAAMIAAAMTDFVLHLPAPQRITDEQLRSIDIPVLAFIAGRSVMLDAQRAADKARKQLAHGQVELWPEASHAINGEFPERIAQVAHRFWDAADGARH